MPSNNRKVSAMFGMREEGTLKNVSSSNFISDTRIGIEVEAEGLPLNRRRYEENPGDLQTHWNIVRDGSLRGDNSAEFVFKEPMYGKDIDDALVSLFNTVGSIPESRRTSVHVHLDVRGMSFQQLLNLVIVYVLVEPILFAQVSPKRLNNPYCAELRSCPSYLENIRHCLTSNSTDGYYSSLGGASGNKYTALNLLPIATQGSIEFRHKEGTTDIKAIRHWVNVIYSLQNYAMSCTPIDNIERVDNIMQDYSSFLSDVFTGVDVGNLGVFSEELEHDSGIYAKVMMFGGEEDVSDSRTFNEAAPFWRAAPLRFKEMFQDLNYIREDVVQRVRRRESIPSNPPPSPASGPRRTRGGVTSTSIPSQLDDSFVAAAERIRRMTTERERTIPPSENGYWTS